MSEILAECGCQMIQDGIIGETPVYGVRFCDVHDPEKIGERNKIVAEATAKKLVQHMATHMERESFLLYPDPATIMMDPYGLLDLIRTEGGFEPWTIDEWMIEAQKSTKE